MSIEQKIAQILAESRQEGQDLDPGDEDVEALEGAEEETEDQLEEAINFAADQLGVILEEIDGDSDKSVIAEAIASVVRVLPESLFVEWTNELGLEFDSSDWSSLCEEVEDYYNDEILSEGLLGNLAGAAVSGVKALGAKTAQKAQQAGASVAGKIGGKIEATRSRLAKAAGVKSSRANVKKNVFSSASDKLRQGAQKSSQRAAGHALSGINRLTGAKTATIKSSFEYPNLPSIQEDVDALVSGEELTEEFKQKAATIFEAAVINRVKEEVTRLDEAYQVALEEQVESVVEGLIEKVDGYLDYVVEQWIEQNEIALERGMRSEILENFVGGLKSLFEEHYIDVPEEKFDIVDALQEQVEELTESLNAQMASNVELNSVLSEYQKNLVVEELSEGLVATDKDKFQSLVEDLEFDDVKSFEKKAQTIRESYFTNKKATGRSVVNSVVTDTPVYLEEDNKYVDPAMRGYLSVLNNLK